MANKKYEIPEDDVMMVSEPVAEYAVSVEKSPAMKSYERARADVKAGRVVKCKDKEDFFAKLGL